MSESSQITDIDKPPFSEETLREMHELGLDAEDLVAVDQFRGGFQKLVLSVVGNKDERKIIKLAQRVKQEKKNYIQNVQRALQTKTTERKVRDSYQTFCGEDLDRWQFVAQNILNKDEVIIEEAIELSDDFGTNLADFKRAVEILATVRPRILTESKEFHVGSEADNAATGPIARLVEALCNLKNVYHGSTETLRRYVELGIETASRGDQVVKTLAGGKDVYEGKEAFFDICTRVLKTHDMSWGPRYSTGGIARFHSFKKAQPIYGSDAETASEVADIVTEETLDEHIQKPIDALLANQKLFEGSDKKRKAFVSLAKKGGSRRGEAAVALLASRESLYASDDDVLNEVVICIESVLDKFHDHHGLAILEILRANEKIATGDLAYFKSCTENMLKIGETRYLEISVLNPNIPSSLDLSNYELVVAASQLMWCLHPQNWYMNYEPREKAYLQHLVEACQGDVTKLQKITATVKSGVTYKMEIKFLDLLEGMCGDDLGKLERVGAIVEDKPGVRTELTALLGIHEVYGTDLDRFEEVATIVNDLAKKGGSIACETLLTIKEVYGTDFDQFKEVSALLIKVFEKDLASLDDVEDKNLGEKISKWVKGPGIVKITRKVAGREFEKLRAEVLGEEITLTEDNWLPLVMAFVRTTFDDHELPSLTGEAAKKVAALFQRDDVKSFCLDHLKQLWLKHLEGGQTNTFPFRLMILAGFVNDCEGAGPLMQFEALSLFINKAREALSATTERTAKEIPEGMKAMEDRFTKERWSKEDQTDFYNVSRDILQAAPSLYANFLETFKSLSPAELKRFIAELYPLFRAQLAVMPRTVKKGGTEARHDPRELVRARRHLKEFELTMREDPGAFDRLKKELIGEMTENFKSRFGIIKIPNQFTEEHVRSLTNVTLYLANLHDRTEVKEKLLGWYLALLVNGKWDNYRRGESIDPSEYLLPANASVVGEVIQRRGRLSPLTHTSLGITEAELPELQTLLQSESSNLAVGDVETIDVKLSNVILNLRGLKDPDLYPDAMDRQRLQLLLNFGNKPTGAVAAKLYLQLSRPDRAPTFSAVEEEIRIQMITALESTGLPVTAENIKLHFQEGMKALAIVISVLQSIEDLEAEPAIDRLRALLTPSDEVIAVFTRLGEEFKPTSGAMALSQDLDYLDNIIVKRQDELKPEEKTLLTDYVRAIRTEMVNLQGIYDQVKTKFANVRGGNAAKSNPLLSAKLGEVEKIINNQAVQQSVTSTMTDNLNAIIENIRECLSCTRQGCNNDTDLTFGDSNKFFIYSHSEAQRKGSVADQIVFLEPVTYPDGRQEMAFVFDRVYGSCTPFILTNHIASTFKKYRSIKQKFPKCKLSLVVTDAAISTGGVSTDQLAARLRDQLGKDVTVETSQLEVDVVESATGDHYVEFGGQSRENGKRSVSGLVIKLAA